MLGERGPDRVLGARVAHGGVQHGTVALHRPRPRRRGYLRPQEAAAQTHVSSLTYSSELISKFASIIIKY